MPDDQTVRFELNGMLFEYDKEKNRINLRKHGISFHTAAHVFFDYDRIEMYDEENSTEEDRYNVIGNVFSGSFPNASSVIGSTLLHGQPINDILFVVYTEREMRLKDGQLFEITRLISARLATSFERGLYYGKYT